MSSKKQYVLARILAKFSFAIVFLFLVCTSTPLYAESSCSLQRFEKLKSQPTENLSVRENASGQNPAEGLTSKSYFVNDRLARLIVTQLGETQKTRVHYVFASRDEYMATITDYLYSSPIYTDQSQEIARIKVTFIVCDGKPQHAVNQTQVREYVRRAMELLRQIRMEGE